VSDVPPGQGASSPPLAPPPLSFGRDDVATSRDLAPRLARLGRLPLAIAVLTAMSVATSLSATIVLLTSRNEADDFLDGRTSESVFEDALRPAGTLGLVQLVLLWATAITTMVWLVRILRNHRALGRETRWAPGWGIGAWLVPPGMLYVVPFLVLREAWRASSPDSGDGWRRSPVPVVLTAWWVLFGLVPLALLLVGGRAVIPGAGGGTTADVAESVRDDATVSVLSFVATAAAGACWIVVVRALSARHRARTGEGAR
jgi:hypothetical protein